MWLFGNMFAQSSRQQIYFHGFLEEIMHLKCFTISDKPVKILPQPPDGRFNVIWTFVWSLTQRLGLSFQLNHLPGHSAFLKSSWNQLHRHISCILGLLSWSWATCVFKTSSSCNWITSSPGCTRSKPWGDVNLPNLTDFSLCEDNTTGFITGHRIQGWRSPLWPPVQFFHPSAAVLFLSVFCTIHSLLCFFESDETETTNVYVPHNSQTQIYIPTQHSACYIPLLTLWKKADSNGHEPHPQLSPNIGFQYHACALRMAKI